ncbi:tigger transposable element-derived protein 6-like [Octopus sinensis]|uniref:Tigger transposable element-derived protein 6-like n=1 Tax=Octopus sinensis TaxID=2607531 RepID=A0A6P7TPW0_9MOLL|nr:tigger transposable element-derived protein 6-like [Octopus sinensis]XP_029654057.1 tigger transposable element-derived protein 6-like [Octopus sinensis]XP_029656514.1 tigger transposable element-derived protein 6-like [Octopus sinensis]XP_029657936.1 tigger transposable element-derived protein 6-like [Octopus sinensis]
MITWINLMESSGAILSDSMLIAKALKFGKNFPEFKASRGWLEKFKLRNGIKLRKLHGNSGSVNHDEKSITDFNETMSLKIEQYGLDNVYNADETGVFYKETLIEEESNEKKVDLSEAFRALEIIKTYASQVNADIDDHENIMRIGEMLRKSIKK